VPFPCELCSSRIYASSDDVGSELRCPDCHTINVVPPLSENSEKEPILEDLDDELKLSDPIVPLRPKLEDFVHETGIDDTVDKSGDVRNPDRDDESTVEKQWFSHETPSALGIYLQRGVLTRLCLLTFPLALAMFFGVIAIRLGQAEAEGISGVVQLVLSLVLMLLSTLLAVPWLAVTSVYGLSLLVDTAMGHEQVEGWPEGPWSEWITQAWTVVVPLFGTAVPAAALAYWLEWKAAGLWLVLGGIPCMLFPIFLLSMLTANSLLVVVALDVIQHSARHPGAWLLHYCEAAFLGVVALSLLIACNWLVGPFGWFCTSFLLATVITATTFLYFRLLGRLARRLSLIN